MKTPIRIGVLAIVLLAPALPACAQDNVAPLANGDYWRNYPRGVTAIATAPARWNRAQWRTAILTAGVTGGLFLVDGSLRDYWQDDVRGGVTDTLADISRPFGSNAGIAVGSLALVGTGLLADNTRLQETGLLTFQGMVLSNVTLMTLKMLAHRRRPEESPGDPHHWDGPSLHGSYKSFPSGHAAKAFMLASVITAQYPDNPPLKVAAYSLAGLTALGRINDDRHWASDVVAGAAIGLGIGTLVTAMPPFDADSRVSLSPVTPAGDSGLSLAYHF